MADFEPDVIVFCGGNAAWLYPKVLRLAKRFDAKIAFYITDDYVLPKKTLNVADQLTRWWTRRVFVKMIRASSLILTVGEDMSAAYKDRFGADSQPLMNLVEVTGDSDVAGVRPSEKEAVRFLFAGSLHSGRWRVIEEVALAIEGLRAQGVDAELHLYGPEPEADVVRKIDHPPASQHMGMLDSAQLSDAMQSADVLLHVESSEPGDVATTALSVSTKIPEYLAAGRCILAVGPPVASLNYLERHDAAVVLRPGDRRGLEEGIRALATDNRLRREIAERGLLLARANHAGEVTRPALWAQLRELT